MGGLLPRLLGVGFKGLKNLKSTKVDMAGLGWSAFHIGTFALAMKDVKNAPPEEKLRRGTQEAILTAVGLAHPGIGGIAMTAGLALAFESGAIGRGIVQGVRGGLENRTMMQVPFSHSTVNMQQAGLSLQYAQKRMGSAYGMGNEAAIFAARYLGA